MNHEWYVIEDNAGRYLRCRLTGKWIPIEHAAERLNDQQARIQAAIEVYAGMEGFIPETAAEGYCLRIIEQMNKALLGQEGE